MMPPTVLITRFSKSLAATLSIPDCVVCIKDDSKTPTGLLKDRLGVGRIS